MFVSDLLSLVFDSTPVFPRNKHDHYHTNALLSKVTLNTTLQIKIKRISNIRESFFVYFQISNDVRKKYENHIWILNTRQKHISL